MPWFDPNDQYQKGGHYIIDAYSGFKVRGYFAEPDWRGLMTENPDVRNAQDLMRGRKPEPMSIGPSPEPPSSFIGPTDASVDDF